MSKKRSVFWCFFLLISSTISAQNVEALRTLMQSKLLSMGKNPVHSIQVYISKGDTVFNEAVGFSDGKNIIADKHNQYKIASITKTMTSVVILQLQEEGSIKWLNQIKLQTEKI